MGRTKVLPNDSVPDSLSWTGHSHGEWQESEVSHTLGEGGHQSLVSSNSGVVVDVSWFGKTDDGVNKNVGSSLSGGSDGQLSVGSVHWVSGLESDDLSPRDFVEVGSKLGGRVSETDVVVVGRSLDSRDRSTDVELLDLVVEVEGVGMGNVVGTEDLLGLERLVWSVNVVD